MPVHRIAHDLGRTAELGGVDNGLGPAEHPVPANWAFAMDHSRGGIFYSFSDRFKIR
jgi:hypothetical protein